MRRWAYIPAMFMLCAAAAAAPPGPGRFTFRWEDGRCWLEANEARVGDILQEVSRATGIPVSVDPADASTVTVALDGCDLEKLVNAISSGATITFAQDPATGDYRIEKIMATTSVDAEVKQAQLRDMVIRQKALEQKLAGDPPQPVRYSGIGARIALSEDRQGVWLRPLTPDAPAAQAGLRKGDLVVAIDGKPVAAFGDLNAIVAALRGPQNSVVRLSVRGPDGATVEKPVVRRVYEFRPGTRP